MPLELQYYSDISERIASHISLYILNGINTLSNLKKNTANLDNKNTCSKTFLSECKCRVIPHLLWSTQ